MLAPFVLLAIWPGVVAPHDPNALLAAPFEPPSRHYLLGTDEAGRDLFSRLIWGARADIGISLISTLLAGVVGTAVGLFAGYVGSVADVVVMRLTDVVLSFPSILLAIFLITVVGRGAVIMVGAIVLLFIPGFVRLARGLALSLRGRGYVEASVISGGRAWHVILRHILPNAAGPLLVGLALTAATSLLLAASLSYLGVGLQPPTSSWGSMLQSSFQWLFQAPLYGVMPGVCITLVALAYTWLADGLQRTIGAGGRRVRTVGALTRELGLAAGLDDEASRA